MKIKQIELKNYRNHSEYSLDFDPIITLITGPNGSGKTNIIEAVNLVSTGKAFRAELQNEIISHGSTDTEIKALVTREERDLKIGISVRKESSSPPSSIKTVKVNGKRVKISSLGEYFNTVLFSPLDMNLLRSGPSIRRITLNNILTQTSRAYSSEVSNYNKARRHRNKVLKTIRETGSGYAQLRYWDNKIIAHGRVIQKERAKFLNQVNQDINEHLKKIDPSMETRIKYDISLLIEERLEEAHPEEIRAGTSLIGPHRDDFLFTSERRDLAKYASRGQQRALILAFKICELNFLRSSAGEAPVLLLDDVLSEFDSEHRNSIETLIGDHQTIITATELPKAYEKFKNTIL